MTSKSDFTLEEWELVLRSPFEVVLGTAAIGSDSLVGASETPQELAAGWKELGELAQAFPGNSILHSLSYDVQEADTQQAYTNRPVAGHAFDELLQMCQQVADLLDRKATPQEAAEFKRYLLIIAARVAGAAGGVGGFPGFARKKIGKLSAEEAQALKKIAAALRVT